MGVTTGAWIMRNVAARLRAVGAWEVLPDFASVNWSEEGAPDLAELLLSKGIGVEAGLFTVEDATAFAGSPIAPRCLRALIEVRARDGASPVETAARMDAALLAGGLRIPILHHGFAAGTWLVLEAAFLLGRDVRIGLEDTFTLPDGVEAHDKAALVRAAVVLARSHNRAPRPPYR